MPCSSNRGNRSAELAPKDMTLAELQALPRQSLIFFYHSTKSRDHGYDGRHELPIVSSHTNTRALTPLAVSILAFLIPRSMV